MSENNQPGSPAEVTPAQPVEGAPITEQKFQAESAPDEKAPAETPAIEPPVESIEAAPAEAQPNSSPSTGSESPAPVVETGAEPAPTEQPKTEPEKPDEKPTAEPAPTLQPPLPGVGVFEEHGRPAQGTQPAVKKGVYVDADGTKYQVEIVAERKDGSVDIMLPATIGGYRRDAVRRRESDEQKGDYIE